ncbi:MAG: COX15/CtaA family protein [Bacteroidia bacterium]|nr:COX15/CtaA family protein [Bacteroidia bacterium]
MNYIKINRRFGILTISSVFLLLIAGGVVRSTGSGMGCPDWPKCYGMLLPPTCPCELPINYQSIYVEKRIKKAERFARLLNNLGMEEQANKLLNDPNLKEPEVFNVYKAWTEYINRIIGVLSGLFSLIFVLSILKVRKFISNKRFWAGIIGFILMMFNAWLGSIVVATNLFPVIISIHYLASYAVLVAFMISLEQARIQQENIKLMAYKWFYLVFTFVSLLQVVYGTQLREVSSIALKSGNLMASDGVNFDLLGNVFKIHWVLAILLIAISLIPAFKLRNKVSAKWFRLVLAIPIILVIQYISGVLNLRFAFPLIAQVSHIFFAGLIFGITLYICIAIFRSPKTIV